MDNKQKRFFFCYGVLHNSTGHILSWEEFQKLEKARKLSIQHDHQCVNDCNGEGYIPRKGFFNVSDASCYVGDETVFNLEAGRIADKIRALFVDTLFKPQFQGDPRGWTVRLFLKEQDVSIVIH
jgi:hypothetical protein